MVFEIFLQSQIHVSLFQVFILSMSTAVTTNVLILGHTSLIFTNSSYSYQALASKSVIANTNFLGLVLK